MLGSCLMSYVDTFFLVQSICMVAGHMTQLPERTMLALVPQPGPVVPRFPLTPHLSISIYYCLLLLLEEAGICCVVISVFPYKKFQCGETIRFILAQV